MDMEHSVKHLQQASGEYDMAGQGGRRDGGGCSRLAQQQLIINLIDTFAVAAPTCTVLPCAVSIRHSQDN